MLFQKNIVKKYIGLLDEELITKGWLNLFMYAIIEKFLQRYENSHSLRHEWECFLVPLLHFYSLASVQPRSMAK